jgi:hypothetical protein
MEPHRWSWRSWWRPPSARGLLLAAVVLVLTCGALAVVKPAGAAVMASVPDVPSPTVGRSSESAGLADPARVGGAAPVLAVVGGSFAAGVGAAAAHGMVVSAGTARGMASGRQRRPGCRVEAPIW